MLKGLFLQYLWNMSKELENMRFGELLEVAKEQESLLSTIAH
jgi:hypothetical protein